MLENLDSLEIFCEKCGDKMILKHNGNEDVKCICEKCCRYVIRKLFYLIGSKTKI